MHLWTILGSIAVVLSGLVQGTEKDYVLINKSFTTRPGVQQTLVDFSNMKAGGRHDLVSGNMTIVEDMDDTQYAFDVQLSTSPAGDGKYKKAAMDIPKTAVCEGMQKFYKQFVQPSFNKENTNFPWVGDDGLCPFPAGTYFFKDIIIDITPWPAHMPHGVLKAEVTFYKGGLDVGGFEWILKLDPVD